MYSLRLNDPTSGIAVECPDPSQPWELREAVKLLVNTIVKEQNIHPLQAMTGDRSFEIVVDNGGGNET
jgi:hypothetical protein